jgi:hypothetical protein
MGGAGPSSGAVLGRHIGRRVFTDVDSADGSQSGGGCLFASARRRRDSRDRAASAAILAAHRQARAVNVNLTSRIRASRSRTAARRVRNGAEPQLDA